MNKKLFPLHKWPHQLDYISLINKDEKYYCYYCFGAWFRIFFHISLVKIFFQLMRPSVVLNFFPHLCDVTSLLLQYIYRYSYIIILYNTFTYIHIKKCSCAILFHIILPIIGGNNNDSLENFKWSVFKILLKKTFNNIFDSFIHYSISNNVKSWSKKKVQVQFTFLIMKW